MAYRGSSYPALVYYPDGTPSSAIVYDLPIPDKGGREEEFEDLTTYYENIYGEIISGTPSWRFVGKYTFSNVSQSIIDVMIDMQNKTKKVKWIPHEDITAIAYEVILEKVAVSSLGGFIGKDSMQVEIKSVNPIFKQPTGDNIFGAVLPFRIAVKNDE